MSFKLYHVFNCVEEGQILQKKKKKWTDKGFFFYENTSPNVLKSKMRTNIGINRNFNDGIINCEGNQFSMKKYWFSHAKYYNYATFVLFFALACLYQ